MIAMASKGHLLTCKILVNREKTEHNALLYADTATNTQELRDERDLIRRLNFYTQLA